MRCNVKKHSKLYMIHSCELAFPEWWTSCSTMITLTRSWKFSSHSIKVLELRVGTVFIYVPWWCVWTSLWARCQNHCIGFEGYSTSCSSGFGFSSVTRRCASTNAQVVSSHDHSWFMQLYCQSSDTVPWKKTGNKSRNPEFEEWMDCSIAYHLGVIRQDFESGVLHEDSISSMDETHFVYDVADRNVLSKKGTEITNKDMVSCGRSLSFILCLTGGRHSQLLIPFFIIKNEKEMYPIRGAHDNIPGCSHRTRESEWMYRRVLVEWINEPRSFPRASYG